MNKQNILVIFGGNSTEYEVSLKSATSVLTHIDKTSYLCHMVGITKDGSWLYYTGPIEDIENNTWINHPNNCSCTLSLSSTASGLLVLEKETYSLIPIDVAFPVLHGKNGEDGTIQGLLDLGNIPYVGCGVLSSALCMDKGFANMVMDQNHILHTKWIALKKGDSFSCSDIAKKLDFPIYVKPAKSGSSIGITKATSIESLQEGISLAFTHDDKVILEEFVNGREVEVAVMGNDTPVASIVGEILPPEGLYDFESKYINSKATLTIPAKLPEDISHKIREEALRIYKIFECRGLSRIDFFLHKETNELYLNEINTLPGFTSISMFPNLFIHTQVPYTTLISTLIELGNQGK